MNLILFNTNEIEKPLPIADSRAQHILKVLKVRAGESFDVGLINGPRGKAVVISQQETHLSLSFHWHESKNQFLPINLWVSYCRPQTCRKILQECTSLGIQSISFFDTEKCEPAYRDSKLWSTGEAERLLIRGAEQAFCTLIPKLSFGASLDELIQDTPNKGEGIALDNYEAPTELGANQSYAFPITLAVGGERGWSKSERDVLRQNRFKLLNLGERVLRTETACIAAIAILRSLISD